MSYGQIDFSAMQQRYESLKRMYFNTRSDYDEDGVEIPTLMTRLQIVQMFENMGVEIPLTPQDEMKFKRR